MNYKERKGKTEREKGTKTKQREQKCGTGFHIRYRGDNIAKVLSPFS